MAPTISLQTVQGTLLRSHFLGQNNPPNFPHKPYSLVPKEPKFRLRPCAKFNLSEILGGRGLCNGEAGLQQELKRNVEDQGTDAKDEGSSSSPVSPAESIPEDAFGKEMMGLTGGFPGGEKGLQKFIQENPPPKKQSSADSGSMAGFVGKPKPPELPLLMPGMIAIVKNPNNPYYMYCGIVQRITDGKAGVLLEGGNWDRLITFRLEELQRRDKGPPGKNPLSCVLEPEYRDQSQ
ncbi:hypothetical protein Tsubulata_013768 [Turnera subulata]|uniref:NAD(P)H-quinone oxidoreductase subunit S, chloroplastic n=1 Tax=Turnera subulata TaxID=218843 RepID=A0A9Q0FDQ1_9ROSI|nr:hypothetical protein Tsubulata_013768 [Turnera subulata]